MQNPDLRTFLDPIRVCSSLEKISLFGLVPKRCHRIFFLTAKRIIRVNKFFLLITMEFEVTFTIILVCSVAFFIAGFIDSIAGGGGLITMPVLLLLGLPAHYTLGTAKAASSIGSLTALVTFWRKGAVIKEVVVLGIITSFLGAACASGITLLISNEIMTLVLIFMLPIGLLISLFCGSLKLTDEELPKSHLRLKVCIIGLGIGFYEGFFGPGAGSFYLIGIHLLLKAGLVKASGTAKAFNLASNLGAVTTFASAGTVLLSLAVPCAIASVCGNRLGALYAVKIGPRLIRNVLYFVLFMLLVSLIAKYFYR